MEAGYSVCCGCLSNDRKIMPLKDFCKRQCFLEIINEIPITVFNKDPILICWECDAAINRFIKFKQQVKICFKNLSDYLQQKKDLSELHNCSKLNTHKLFDFYFNPNVSSQFTVDIVKVEKAEEIKEEDKLSAYSDNNDDDTVLIEYRKKKKKKIKERTKRKKENDDRKIVLEIELTAEEITQERNTLAEKEEYLIAMFRCEKCIVTFPNVDDMNDHMKLKHEANKSKLQCNICECTFATEMSYTYHTNKHMKRYQCTACLELFNNKRAANMHYQVIHCHGTDEDYQVNGTGELHENGDIEYKPVLESIDNSFSTKQEEFVSFSCELCEKKFRWKTSLRKHMETHRIETGQKRKPYCEPCRLSFATTSNLQKHVRRSSKHQIQLKLWKQKESPSGDSHSVEQIARSVNDARLQYPCAQCGRSFQWRGNLKRHLRSHRARANGELVCEPCNRTFSSIATYNQHMKISKKHVSESDFKYMCSDCGKKFPNKIRLKDHINWEHLKNFVHTCSTCQKVFKSHTSLYLHNQIVHKKDSAEHLCDHCGKHFPNRTKLGSHVAALHSGAAPFACSHCPARFSWRSCLSRHARRVHTASDSQ